MLIKMPKVKTFLDLGLLIFTLKTGFDISAILPSFGIIDTLVVVLGLGSLFLAILQQGYSIKTLFTYALIAILSLCSTYLSGQSVIIVTVVTIMAIRRTDISKVIVKIRKWSTAFLFVHTLIFFFLVAIGRCNFFSIDLQGRIRASFGFVHANTFSIYFFNILLGWIWENFDKLTGKEILKIWLLETISFLLTNSKTSYFCAGVFLVLLVMLKSKKLSSKGINVLAAGIVPALSAIFYCVYILWLKGNAFIYLLDTALTGRIELGAYALRKYGVSTIGQKIEYGVLTWTPEWKLNYFTLDCTYTCLWMNIGWIWIVILSICFFLLSQKKDSRISLFIIMWALYAISEVHGLNGYLCFPIFLIAYLLQDKKNGVLYDKCKSVNNCCGL